MLLLLVYLVLLQCPQWCYVRACHLCKTTLLRLVGTAAAATPLSGPAALCHAHQAALVMATKHCAQPAATGVSTAHAHVSFWCICDAVCVYVHIAAAALLDTRQCLTCFRCACIMCSCSAPAAAACAPGVAAVPAVVQCEDLPPVQDNAAEAGWNSSCSNATVGSSCTLPCASGSVGDGYQALCTASGNWSVNGTCAGMLDAVCKHTNVCRQLLLVFCITRQSIL
jgi:hypothetical protein